MAPISLRKGKVDEIAQDLVHCITKLKSDSENFKISLEFAVSNFRFHRFLDVNPFEVNRKFVGLKDKFIIHCQQQKAEQVIYLKEKYLSLPYSETELTENTDTHYGVLSLLLNLSQSPSNSSYVPNEKEIHTEELDINWTEYLLQGEDKLENGIYITEDQRIALEESDDESLFASVGEAEMKSEEKNVDKDSALELSVSNSDFDNHQKDLLWFKENIMIPYWKSSRYLPTQYDSDFLNQGLMDDFSSALQLSRLDVRIPKNLSEKIIIREVLWMLQGVEETVVFCYTGTQFVARNGNTLCHTSEMALRNLLQCLASAGTKLQHLREYVKKVCDTRTFQLKTCRAFGFAINSFLKLVNKELSNIETSVLKKVKVYTLISLMDVVKPMMKNIDLVHDLFEECVCRENCKKKSNAEIMVHIINTQYLTICKLDILGPAYRSQLTVMLPLFLETIQPCLVDLGAWIMDGKLPHVSPDEFFIQRNTQVGNRDSDAWQTLYHVNSMEERGQTKYLIPVFLIESATKILLAGKSYGLLEQAKSNQHIKIDHSFDEEFLQNFFANLGVSSKDFVTDDEKFPSLKTELVLKEGKQHLLLADNFQAVFFDIYETICNVNLSDQEIECTTGMIEKSDYENSIENGIRSPLKLTFEKTIKNLIDLRYFQASKMVIGMLNDKFQLHKHISVVKNFFLMEAGDIMSLFCSELFMKIRNNGIWQNTSYLTYLLHESLSFRFPNLVATLTVGFKPISDPQGAKTSSDVQSISGIFLHYDLQWPMTIIFHNQAFQRYNAIFSFLLQVKHALWSLEQLRIRDLVIENNETHPDWFRKRQKLYILRMRLMHFIQGFHVYVMTRILHSSGLELQEHLNEARDMEDVISAHQTFLDKVYDRCLLSTKVGFAKEAITRTLNLCLSFRMHWDKGLGTIEEDDISSIENAFLKCSHFIQSFLNKLIKRGSFPHLELLALSLK